MTGIFDSGLGGMSVLGEIARLIPGEDYIYYADSAHCPYGEKSREYVIDRAVSISGTLVREGAGLVVIACNTATAAAIATLRERWPDIPFVGMEPAVKPAALHTHSGVIGVLATAGTLKGSNYLDLRDRYSGNVKVVEHVGKGFVELVEKGVTDGPEAESTVRESLMPLLESGADTIVLGCTHYPFLEPVIRRIAGPGIEIINPAPAVARRVLDLLCRRTAAMSDHIHDDAVISRDPGKRPDIRFISSAGVEAAERLRSFWETAVLNGTARQ